MVTDYPLGKGGQEVFIQEERKNIEGISNQTKKNQVRRIGKPRHQWEGGCPGRTPSRKHLGEEGGGKNCAQGRGKLHLAGRSGNPICFDVKKVRTPYRMGGGGGVGGGWEDHAAGVPKEPKEVLERVQKTKSAASTQARNALPVKERSVP